MKTVLHTIDVKSKALSRTLQADLILPAQLDKSKSYPLLILNDGQDMQPMHMKHLLEQVWEKKISKPFILLAPYAKARLEKYGVANNPDFKGRGNRAADYTTFIVEEMLPYLKTHLNIDNFSYHVIGGFSLGGLSAFDIAWNNPNIFKKVGVCSGSFWWRSKDLNKGYTDADRIMHSVVKNTNVKPDLKVWLQCGSLDETADRNNNGIIDSIDDTLDLIKELEAVGFRKNRDLFYNEVIGGKHTLETYAIVLPYFFQWAFNE